MDGRRKIWNLAIFNLSSLERTATIYLLRLDRLCSVGRAMFGLDSVAPLNRSDTNADT